MSESLPIGKLAEVIAIGKSDQKDLQFLVDNLKKLDEEIKTGEISKKDIKKFVKDGRIKELNDQLQSSLETKEVEAILLPPELGEPIKIIVETMEEKLKKAEKEEETSNAMKEALEKMRKTVPAEVIKKACVLLSEWNINEKRPIQDILDIISKNFLDAFDNEEYESVFDCLEKLKPHEGMDLEGLSEGNKTLEKVDALEDFMLKTHKISLDKIQKESKKSEKDTKRMEDDFNKDMRKLRKKFSSMRLFFRRYVGVRELAKEEEREITPADFILIHMNIDKEPKEIYDFLKKEDAIEFKREDNSPITLDGITMRDLKRSALLALLPGEGIFEDIAKRIINLEEEGLINKEKDIKNLLLLIQPQGYLKNAQERNQFAKNIKYTIKVEEEKKTQRKESERTEEA